MKLKMFAVYDSKSATYSQITTMRRREEAIRAFAIACQNNQSDFYKYAEDYSLFEIASFDDDVGLPVPNNVPELVISAMQARVMFKDDYSANSRLPDDANNVSVN